MTERDRDRDEAYEQSLESDEIALRPTTAHIDLSVLRANVEAIKRRVGRAKIMGIVKANAYGHGLLRIARELVAFGVDALGVAFLEEGVRLRRAGIRAPILVLGGIIGNQIRYFIEHDLEITASSPYKLGQIEEIATAMGRRAKVQLKIDTGMERIGIHWQNADKLFDAAVRADGCDVMGVFSHFASSEAEDKQHTRLQLERFEEATDYFRKRSLPMPARHIANSGAVLQHPDSFYDIVRPGLLLYGLYPSRSVEKTVEVRPALSLKTRVVYFKVVKRGSPVSYNGRWIAPEDTRVVTLPVGYGDGYSRGLSNEGFVLIHGKRYPIVGAVTMDALMVDIGQDSAFNGDEVVLIGAQGSEAIRCEEIAETLGTIPYEVLTSINTRVPRKYE
jgi:alanine racemase